MVRDRQSKNRESVVARNHVPTGKAGGKVASIRNDDFLLPKTLGLKSNPEKWFARSNGLKFCLVFCLWGQF